MKIYKFILLTGLSIATFFVNATLTVDRTRIIYDEQKKGTSIVVENTDTKEPFLAQVWLETADGTRVKEPLVALPVLQRIDPKQKKQVRLTKISSDVQLADDRESLFYFNLIGVPPKSKLNNVVEIVIQSRFKLFYRPKGLPQYLNNNWPESITIQQKGDQLILNNPTPYHVVLININDTADKVKNFNEVILAPFSDVSYGENKKLAKSKKLALVYIDDYGATKLLNYRCDLGTCKLQVEP